VATAAPDGYTLFLGSNTTHVLQPLLKERLSYDPIKDFEVVSVFAANSTVVAVSSSLPFQNLQEMVAYSKANPGKLAFGHGGPGGSTHVTGELFKQLTGTDILQVSYRGLGPATTGLLSGDVQCLMANVTGQVIAMAENQKMRILSVNAPDRLASLPNVPTSIEAGVPGMVSQSFFGVFAPAGTSRVILEALNRATQDAMRDPEFLKQLTQAGFEAMPDNGLDKAAQYIRSEYERWAPIAKIVGPIQ
jgi:tripartite-type tricarboxylate transporter receptor subunit TctC